MRSWLFAFEPNQSREHANPWGLVPFRVGSRLTGRGWPGAEAGVAVLSGLAPPPLAEEGSVGYRAVSHRGVDEDAGWTRMRCIECGPQAVTERPERTAQGYRRFRCRACGKQFNERSGGVLNRTQYPSDVIALVVLWRLRYKLSLRDLPEMFAVRGIVFSYEAVREWEATHVYSRHLVERVEPEPFRLACPLFTDERVGREPLQGLEPAPEVVGGDEVRHVRAQLVVRGVVEPLNRGFLDGAVHALDLSIRPSVSRLGQTVRHIVLGTGEFEGVGPEQLLAREHVFDLVSLISSGVQVLPLGSVKCVPLSVRTV